MGCSKESVGVLYTRFQGASWHMFTTRLVKLLHHHLPSMHPRNKLRRLLTIRAAPPRDSSRIQNSAPCDSCRGVCQKLLAPSTGGGFESHFHGNSSAYQVHVIESWKLQHVKANHAHSLHVVCGGAEVPQTLKLKIKSTLSWSLSWPPYFRSASSERAHALSISRVIVLVLSRRCLDFPPFG